MPSTPVTVGPQGQGRRVRLAMAFRHEPELVLLDEPHTSLDEFGLALLEDAMAGVTGRGGAVLWCSPASTPLPLHERGAISRTAHLLAAAPRTARALGRVSPGSSPRR